MNAIQIHQDELLELVGPTDIADAAPITSGATCTGRLYDDDLDVFAVARYEELLADAAAGATTLSVASSARFVTGQAVVVELDDFTLHSTTLAAVPTATSLQLTAAIPAGRSAHKRDVVQRLVHPTGATLIEVGGGRALRYAIGDAIEVRQDDGSRLSTTVAGRGPTWIQLAAALTQPVSMARRIVRKLGADISMLIYNAAGAAAFAEDWGYRGTIAKDHLGLRLGQRVRAETQLTDSAGKVLLDQSLRLLVLGAG